VKEDRISPHLPVGQVLKPQGLMGTVKIRPDTDDPGRFLLLTRVLVESKPGQAEPVEISGVSVRGGFVYLRMGEDQNVEDAEKRRGKLLLVAREDAVPLGEFENFISDMIGCRFVDRQGHEIGDLTDVLQPGANDVYIVRTKKGNLLIPALKHVVLSVDTVKREIVVDEERLTEVAVLED